MGATQCVDCFQFLLNKTSKVKTLLQTKLITYSISSTEKKSDLETLQAPKNSMVVADENASVMSWQNSQWYHTVKAFSSAIFAGLDSTENGVETEQVCFFTI